MTLNPSNAKTMTAIGAAALLSNPGNLQAELSNTNLPAISRSAAGSNVASSNSNAFYKYSGATFPSNWLKATTTATVNQSSSTEILTAKVTKPKDQNLNVKTLISLCSTALALAGYALALHRGTPEDQRHKTTLGKACEKLFPDSAHFPNNRATWALSTLNSSSLFLLGILQATKSGQSLTSSILSMAVVGTYAIGSGWIWAHANKHDSVSRLHPRDKRCLVGGCVGVGIFLYAGIARLGYLPSGNLPLEMLGICVGLATRGLAFTPLIRELHTAVAQARERSSQKIVRGDNAKALPSLGAQAFWNAALYLNFLNLPDLASKAAIVPIGMALQNAYLLGTALWAYYHVGRSQETSESSVRKSR